MRIIDNFDIIGVEDVQFGQSDYQISVEDVMSDMDCDIVEFESFGLEGLNIKDKAKAVLEWILKQLRRLANFFKTLWNKIFNKEKKIEKTIKEIKTEIKKSGTSLNNDVKEKQVEPIDKPIEHGKFVAVIKADTKTPDTIVQRLKKCDTSITIAGEILTSTVSSIEYIKSMSVNDDAKHYIEEVMHTITKLNKIVSDKMEITEGLNYTNGFDISTLGGSVKAIDEMFKAVIQINLGFKECSKLLDETVLKVNSVLSKRGMHGIFEGAMIDANVSAINELSRHLYQQVTKSFNDLDTCALSVRSYVKKLGGHKLESTESVDSVNKIVESILEEYGIEGVTNVIKNLSSK